MENPIRLGNVYDERFGTGMGGNVWDVMHICPTLQTAQGGGRQPMIIEVMKIEQHKTNRQPSESTYTMGSV